jgi:hypothetical protein
MDREKVRLIVRNMELLVNSLKQELESLPTEILTEENAVVTPFTEDYDEAL